jgi:serine O-acetyltransferase
MGGGLDQSLRTGSVAAWPALRPDRPNNMADIKPHSDSTHPHWNLDSVVAELRASGEGKHRTRHPKGLRELPSRTAMAQVLANLRAVLFPTHFGTPDLTDESIDFFVGNTHCGAQNCTIHQQIAVKTTQYFIMRNSVSWA